MKELNFGMKRFKILFWTHEELESSIEPREIQIVYARSFSDIEKRDIYNGVIKCFVDGHDTYYPLAQWARIDVQDLGSCE